MGKATMRCVTCGAEYPMQELYRCPRDNGELQFVFDYKSLGGDENFRRRFSSPMPMWQRFFDLLPLRDPENIVSLGEGNTALVRAKRLGDFLGISNLYLKLESTNPTGSFKDRQMTVGVSAGKEWGRHSYCTVSSGNVGNSLSAYSAMAGFRSYVWVAEDVAKPKYQQIQLYGCQLFHFPSPSAVGVEYYNHFFNGMPDFCRANDMLPMISARPVNPYMVEGSKTISFELFEQLGQRVPDAVFSPVGGGGLYSGMWKGFRELQSLGFTQRLPAHFACQQKTYMESILTLDDPDVDHDAYAPPLDGRWALQSLRDPENAGAYLQVDDDELLEAQHLFCTMAGIFAEPAGIVSAAGLIKAARTGALDGADTVVCVITGNGLKDMPGAEKLLHDAGKYPPIRFVRSFAECETFIGDEEA